MNVLTYHFSTISKNTNHYLLQLTQGRKLSSILHSHDFFEIILVINGSCTQMINGVQYAMETGDFIFIRPNDTHVFLTQSENTNLLCLSIEAEEFQKILSFFGPEIESKLYLPENPDGLTYNSNMSHLYQDSATTEYDYKFLLCQLIKGYIDCELPVGKKIPKELSHVLKEMKSPENLKIGMDAMLKTSYYSYTQLSRLIKQHLGITLHEYIMKIRLEAAYNAVIFTSARIEDISDDVGYASFSHFNQIFKKKFGITPAALRKKYNMQTV